MLVLGMACGFNEYELYIIWKICHNNRWCEKHISRQDLIKGRQSDKIGRYKDAIEGLVTKGILKAYHAHGRNDVCMPKQQRNKVLAALKAHQNEYMFIRYLEFIK